MANKKEIEINSYDPPFDVVLQNSSNCFTTFGYCEAITNSGGQCSQRLKATFLPVYCTQHLKTLRKEVENGFAFISSKEAELISLTRKNNSLQSAINFTIKSYAKANTDENNYGSSDEEKVPYINEDEKNEDEEKLSENLSRVWL